MASESSVAGPVSFEESVGVAKGLLQNFPKGEVKREAYEISLEKKSKSKSFH